MTAWLLTISGVTSYHGDSTAAALLRTFSPPTLFTVWNSDGTVETWRGSPALFLGWQLCLCAVAVAVAVLRGASPALRRRLAPVFTVAVVLSAAAWVLSATGGHQTAVQTTPTGVVTRI